MNVHYVPIEQKRKTDMSIYQLSGENTMIIEKEVKTNKTWVCFYILYLILSSYSVYMVVFPIGTIVQIGSLAFSAITILYVSHGKIAKKDFCIPLLVSLLFVSTSFLTTTDTFATIMIFARLTLIFFCVSAIRRKEYDLLRIVYQCLFFLMTFYFCCYVIFDVMAPNLGLSYVRENIVNLDGISTYRVFEKHFSFYIRWATSASFFGVSIKRLCGFCWEAGQYQIYLNFVLMYLLFFDKSSKYKKYKILFTTLNIILCTSSMGFLVMVAMYMIALMQQKNKILRVLCFIPLLVVGVFSMLSIIQAKSVDSAYSFTNRTSELELITDIFFRNNIFGAANIATNGSNGLIRFLWAYGYLAIAAAVGIAVCIWKNKNLMELRRQKIVFFIWLVLSLFNEPIEYFNFTLLVVAIVVEDSLGWNGKEIRKKVTA